jgi:hypothetical protein
MIRILAVSAAVALSPTPAVPADNTSCAGSIFVVPDGSRHEGSFTAAGQLRWFRFIASRTRRARGSSSR